MNLRKILGWLLVVVGVVFLLQWLNMFFSGDPIFTGLKLLVGVKDSYEPAIIAAALIIVGWIVRRD